MNTTQTTYTTTTEQLKNGAWMVRLFKNGCCSRVVLEPTEQAAKASADYWEEHHGTFGA
jgi:hypothetical protein